MAPISRSMGRELMQQISQATIATELLYAFLIIAICFMIYFSTRELYNLTKHRGIKYFRISFLFFAIAIFTRSIVKVLVFFEGISLNLDLAARILLGSIIVFLFMYFSTLAILFLLYSARHKKWINEKVTKYIFHAIAAIIALLIVITNNVAIILGVYLLFIFAILLVIFSTKQTKKKKNSLYTIYILLFIFWILNIVDILVPSFLQFTQLLIYLASISIFLTILYRVLRSVGKK